MRHKLTGAVLIAGLLALGPGCVNDIEAHGNQPTEGSMSQLRPGLHSRADVQALLGTPSATSLYGDEAWFYISNQTTQVAFLKPEEIDRQITIVEFDQAGVVSDVIQIYKEDGDDIAISSRETPARGTEQTVFQEFFGNLGRFTPSGLGR